MVTKYDVADWIADRLPFGLRFRMFLYNNLPDIVRYQRG